MLRQQIQSWIVPAAPDVPQWRVQGSLPPCFPRSLWLNFYVNNTNFDLYIPFVDHLGIQLLEKAHGRVRIRFEPRPEHLNSWKGIHGGVIMTLLDVALGSSSRALDPACNGATTVELKANFLAGALGTVTAEGRAQRAGRSLIYAEGEVRDEQGVTLAKGSGTFKLLYPAGSRE